MSATNDLQEVNTMLDDLLRPSESALDVWTRCRADPLASPFPGLDALRPGEPLEIVGSSPTGYEYTNIVCMSILSNFWRSLERQNWHYISHYNVFYLFGVEERQRRCCIWIMTFI